jgi:mannose-6-phosphate isomerase-like protein (cupin superfamily)
MNRVRGAVHIEPKGWGREVWLVNNDQYCGKILEIDKGKHCSLHYHKLKRESFYLESGKLIVRIKQSLDSNVVEEFQMDVGECMDVEPGTVHQLEAVEDTKLFEFSTTHFDSDSYRLER